MNMMMNEEAVIHEERGESQHLLLHRVKES
jgi:hypothetical protein